MTYEDFLASCWFESFPPTPTQEAAFRGVLAAILALEAGPPCSGKTTARFALLRLVANDSGVQFMFRRLGLLGILRRAGRPSLGELLGVQAR